MAHRSDDEFEPDDEDENVSGPPVIGGSHRRPLSGREFPVDQPDFSDDGTDPCPHCGKAIYADGEWCPRCGKYLSEDAPTKPSLWVMVIVIGLVVVSLVGALVGR